MGLAVQRGLGGWLCCLPLLPEVGGRGCRAWVTWTSRGRWWSAAAARPAISLNPAAVAGGAEMPAENPLFGGVGRGQWQVLQATELGPTCGTTGDVLKKALWKLANE